MKQPAMQTFLVPPERYICTPVEALLDDLKRTSGKGHDETFQKVARLLESTAQFDFLSVRRRIINNFRIFALAAAGKQLPQSAGPGPSQEELDRQEVTFVEDMFQLLQAAHFRVLSADEWATAQQESFTFNCPVDINWDYMDSGLFRRFWAAHPEERASAAPISDNILVFMRGISTVRARGSYINDKIDLLVQYLLIDPFQALYSRIRKRDAKLHIALELSNGASDQGYAMAQGPPATIDHTDHGAAQKEEPAEPAGCQEVGSLSKSEDPRLQHAAAQTVQRQTLRHLMPNAAAVFQNLLNPLEIQEPAFKEVVVLYRRKVPDHPVRATEYEPIKPFNPALERRNMNMRRFTDIPMADAEMVFPDKRVFLRPLLVIQLAVAVIGGLVAGLTALISGRLSMQLLLTFLTVVAGRAMQVYTSANYARAVVVDQVTRKMYECTMDAQEGVVTFLLEEMAQQRVKENLLAYAILLQRGQALSQAELDGACEEHLRARFGETRDFAIENSLPTLLADGLITKNAQGKLEAAPVAVAYDRLAQKWMHYFERGDEDEGDHSAHSAQQPKSGGGRPSLFSKICMRPSFGANKGASDKAAETADPTAAADPSAAAPYDNPSTAVAHERPSAGATFSDPLRASPPPKLPAGVISVDTATAKADIGGGEEQAAGGLSEPFHDAEADMEGMDLDSQTGAAQGSGGSKRQKLKEGISSLFGKGAKKEQ